MEKFNYNLLFWWQWKCRNYYR